MAIMKECIICGRNICKNKKDVCETCKEFFDWKYGSKSEEKIALFKELWQYEQKHTRSKSVRRCQ